jgi:hypothetical protein
VARLPWYGLSTGSSARAMGWVTVKTIVEVKQRIREAEHDFVNLWSGAGERGTRCSNLARWRHRTESGERINPIGTNAIAVSRCPRSFPAQNAKAVCCPKPAQVPKWFVAQNWLKCTSAKAGSQRPVDKNVETERFFKKPSGF